MSLTTDQDTEGEGEILEVPPGSVIAGRYEVIRCLGSGGMGSVYLCNDTVLSDEQVAIKILHNDLATDDQQTKRFLREVQLIRKINHRNVVRTFDVGVDGANLYFTMEFIPGTPLDELIEKGKIGINDVGPLMINISEGLDAIHQAGVIHRDLKPANVMVLADGSVKIADFGVARPEDSNLTAHDEIIGSVLFMAPEIWLGKKLTPSIDLYALGILGYLMTTGEYPFDAEKPAALMRLHLDSAPVPPKDKNPDVPVWLNKLILRLLEKSPAKRPESAVDVVEYIKTYTNQRAAGGNTGSTKSAENPADFLNKLEEMSQSSIQKAVDDKSGKRRRTESYALEVPVKSALFRKMKKDKSGSTGKSNATGRSGASLTKANRPGSRLLGKVVTPIIGAGAAAGLIWLAPTFSDVIGAAAAEAFQTAVFDPTMKNLSTPAVLKAAGLAAVPLLATFLFIASIGGRPLRAAVSVLGSLPVISLILAGITWYSLSGISDGDTGFIMQSGVVSEYLGAVTLLSPWVPSRSGTEVIPLAQDWLAIFISAAFVIAAVFAAKRNIINGDRRDTSFAFGLAAVLTVALFIEGSFLFVGSHEVQVRAVGTVVRLPESGIWICLVNCAALIGASFWFRR